MSEYVVMIGGEIGMNGTPLTQQRVADRLNKQRATIAESSGLSRTEVNEILLELEAMRVAARAAVDAVRFQKPEHERAAIDALAALLEKNDD